MEKGQSSDDECGSEPEAPYTKGLAYCCVMVPSKQRPKRDAPHRCKRRVMSRWHGHTMCFTHWQQRYRECYDGRLPDNPWNALHISPCITLDHMTDTNRSALYTRLRQGPDPTQRDEGDGYIYVYTLQHDMQRGDPWFKIGRTIQPVHQRLDQWPGSQLKRSWRVRWNVFAETLIHRVLGHWRAFRMVLYAAKQSPNAAKRFLSMWYQGQQLDSHAKVQYALVHDWVWYGAHHHTYHVHDWLPPLLWDSIHHQDAVTANQDKLYPRSKAKDRYTMEKEWFYCEWDYVERVIEAIVHVINMPFERRHQHAFSIN